METIGINQITVKKDPSAKFVKILLFIQPILWLVLFAFFYKTVVIAQYDSTLESFKDYIFYIIIVVGIMGFLFSIITVWRKKGLDIWTLYLILISLVPFYFLLLNNTLSKIQSFGPTALKLHSVPLDLKGQYRLMVEKFKNPLKLTEVKPSSQGSQLIFENNFEITLKSNGYLNEEEMVAKVERIKNDLLGKYLNIVPPDEKSFIINNCCTKIYYQGALVNEKYR